MEAVLKGKYDLKSDPWHKISDGAKDIIKKMLNPKPKVGRCRLPPC